jgi:hypothetical protein
MDGSSVLWMYHSHFVESMDINTGLIGPIIVTKKGEARPDGSPKDVDTEFIADYAIFDETDSWFAERNLGKRARAVRLRISDPLLRERNLLYFINAFIEGNLPMLTMQKESGSPGISSRTVTRKMCIWHIGMGITLHGTICGWTRYFLGKWLWPSLT